MQVRKVGAVAVGALATVAAIGGPAAAAPGLTTQQNAATTTTATATGAAKALDKVGEPFFQPLITIGTGSSINAAAWQICGSNAVAGPGAVITSGTPHTQLGDCTNSNVKLKQDTVPGLISILDDTSVNAVPWQVCGSNVVAGVGLQAAINSPATVVGDCDNANTQITDGKNVAGPSSLVSVLSGSIVNAAAWQVCGSTAVMGLGVSAGFDSPTTVTGTCRDSNNSISVREPQAAIPVLSNVVLDVLPLQVCEQDSLISLVGLSPAINSPANVLGGCVPPHTIYQ
ncbi:MAG: hypothetical protein HOV77_01555 [Hamadaea sp.]|uniref:hypothetical protein n=1 Tax=Hamadaea sp. TaxID=2024425 RepID=UPI0017B5BFB2|nr:hypothetical protein [Hamadaea sp.]NUT17847.1 hypothetical protein [Hamadaea sp.]